MRVTNSNSVPNLQISNTKTTLLLPTTQFLLVNIPWIVVACIYNPKESSANGSQLRNHTLRKKKDQTPISTNTHKKKPNKLQSSSIGKSFCIPIYNLRSHFIYKNIKICLRQPHGRQRNPQIHKRKVAKRNLKLLGYLRLQSSGHTSKTCTKA